MRISLRKRIGLSLFNRMQKNLIKEHPLQTIFWECTLRCNAKCLHCGSDCKSCNMPKDMPIEDFIKVIDSIKEQVDSHKTFIIFTGGEALVRNDLEECGKMLYQREFPWGIVSNGILLNQNRLESLINAGMHTATISLDGLKENHNWLRGSDCFDKASNAIKLLARQKNIIFDVVTCVNQKNINELSLLKDYLISLGVYSWRLFTIFPVGRAKENKDLQLTDTQFESLMQFIKNEKQKSQIEINYACQGFLGNYEMEVRDHFFNCRAGVSVASILVDGSISSCPSIRSNYSQGNIYKDDFMEVWNNRFEIFRDRNWMKTGICAKCKVFDFCQGNGFHLRDENGNLLECHYQKLK